MAMLGIVPYCKSWLAVRLARLHPRRFAVASAQCCVMCSKGPVVQLAHELQYGTYHDHGKSINVNHVQLMSESIKVCQSVGLSVHQSVCHTYRVLKSKRDERNLHCRQIESASVRGVSIGVISPNPPCYQKNLSISSISAHMYKNLLRIYDKKFNNILSENKKTKQLQHFPFGDNEGFFHPFCF